jgi:hypothetical protein
LRSTGWKSAFAHAAPSASPTRCADVLLTRRFKQIPTRSRRNTAVDDEHEDEAACESSVLSYQSPITSILPNSGLWIASLKQVKA